MTIDNFRTSLDVSTPHRLRGVGMACCFKNVGFSLGFRDVCHATVIERFTVRRSTFIYKDSHEHFEIRTHNRLIDVLEPDSKTIDMLMRLNLPAGVDIEIKI